MELSEIRATEERNKVLSTITSKEIISSLNKRKTNVVGGKTKGYLLHKALIDIEKAIKKFKEEIFETVKDELKDEILENGFKFKLMGGSGRYNFSEYDEWNKLEKRRKDIEENMKISYKTGNIIIDKETGEEYPSAIFKPYKEKISITYNN